MKNHDLASTADTPNGRRAPLSRRSGYAKDNPARAHTSDTPTVRSARLLAVSPRTARFRALGHAVAAPNSHLLQIGRPPVPIRRSRAPPPVDIVAASPPAQDSW